MDGFTVSRAFIRASAYHYREKLDYYTMIEKCIFFLPGTALSVGSTLSGTNQPVLEIAAWFDVGTHRTFLHCRYPHSIPLLPNPSHTIQPPSPSPPRSTQPVVCGLPHTSFCPQEVPSRRLLSRRFILSTTPLVSSFGAHCSVTIDQCSYCRRRPLGIQAPPERDFGVTE